jgi:hypothetical protein
MERFSDGQLIAYVRGITDRAELQRFVSHGPLDRDWKAKISPKKVARERLDNECPKCGSRKKTVTRTFTKTDKQYETETRTGTKHHHYNADGDYRGYTEDEEEVVVEKTVRWAYDERKCDKCGDVWEVLIGKG